MKILLVGEYSRLHNSLKEGLQELGHEVLLVATGDYFKDFPADLKLERKYNQAFSKKIKVGLYRLFNIDITSISIKNQLFKHKEKLKGFDVVQFINESPLGIIPTYEKAIISFLKTHNKKLFLLSCGADYTSVSYLMQNPTKYDILKAYKEGTVKKETFQYALKYLEDSYVELHHFMYNVINGVIASDLDYHIPLLKNEKYLGLIPNPIHIEKLGLQRPQPITDKIIIFLGINRNSYHAKGTSYFEEALKVIKDKYPNKVEIIITENLPYLEYIERYNRAHIFLDQVLGMDQGYNALEAMAKGKVVFTGAEKEFIEHYNLSENEVCINALPDVDYLVEKIENLILTPNDILTIGLAAQNFIKIHHDHKKVAEQYLTNWMKN